LGHHRRKRAIEQSGSVYGDLRVVHQYFPSVLFSDADGNMRTLLRFHTCRFDTLAKAPFGVRMRSSKPVVRLFFSRMATVPGKGMGNRRLNAGSNHRGLVETAVLPIESTIEIVTVPASSASGGAGGAAFFSLAMGLLAAAAGVVQM
jgi:hypothetical protein